MKETYKQRVLRFYRSERTDNNPALQAMRSARFEAKYGEGSFKQNITPLTHGEAYEGEEEHELPRGWKIKFKIQYDSDHEPPWEDCDGMGVVTDWIHGSLDEEQYGWELCGERFSHRYYDWKATLPIAIKEGWGAPPYKTGTKHEQAMRAMRKAYEVLRDWCNDNWWYVGLIVTLYDENGEELGEDSCWGFESNSGSCITEQMRSWAASLIVQARKAKRRETDAWKQLKLEIAA